MPRIYTYNYRISLLGAARTLMYVTAGNFPVEILSASITQDSTNAAQMLTAGIGRVTTLGTPTATTITPSRNDQGSFTPTTGNLVVKANVTASEPTYGAVAAGAQIVDWWNVFAFSSTSGWYFTPYLNDPSRRNPIIILPGDTYGLKLLSAPSGTPSFAVEMIVNELSNTGI